jgi:hypothetical protein
VDIQADSPLEQLISAYWETAGGDGQRLQSLLEQTLHVTLPIDVVQRAPNAAAVAGALKHQVDHPGRFERLAERLLAQRAGHESR